MTRVTTHDLLGEGIRVRFDPECGIASDIEVLDGSRRLAPMHRAPWIGEAMPPDAPPHLARLAGDFFCAPFADGGGTAPVLHGWPANAPWIVAERYEGPSVLRATLSRDVQGARVEKVLRVEDGHPFLYQSHRFLGGDGTISVANHAMVSLPAGGLLSFSPKRVFRTPGAALEPDPSRGRSRLAYPAAAARPDAFPGGDGGPVDITSYPFGPAHEDFVVAVEADGHDLGWTAVVRAGQGDAFLSVKDAGRLPMTMLWHSNGGRDYPPWSGRHRACLGVEEGYAPHVLGEDGGHWLGPGGVLDIRHAIGAIAWPTGEPVSNVEVRGANLRVEGAAGAVREVPFDASRILSGQGKAEA